ncbi:unnamed protein product [Cylicocyclus nassatus]|uniref:Uncharacterized protein n=1 Tax=Cylicocyclus nassatus TaxID=53992 RepID=A0AA36M812_CYLNA|nr:unnamed protein product [Cylicocyclus nassatus]
MASYQPVDGKRRIMYRESMANGFAATVLFLIFLFLLARHVRRMRTVDDELPTVNPAAALPPPYAMPPPPTYSEAVKMGQAGKY